MKRADIVSALSKSYPLEIAHHAVWEWSDFPGIVDHQFFNYIESEYALPIAVLTNGTTRLTSDLEKLGIRDRFFKVAVSPHHKSEFYYSGRRRG